MPESLYGAHPKKLPVRFKLPSHLDLLRFQHAKVKVGSSDHLFLTGERSLMANHRLWRIEEMLTEHQNFVRINRSEMSSLCYLEHIVTGPMR